MHYNRSKQPWLKKNEHMKQMLTGFFKIEAKIETTSKGNLTFKIHGDVWLKLNVRRKNRNLLVRKAIVFWGCHFRKKEKNFIRIEQNWHQNITINRYNFFNP